MVMDQYQPTAQQLQVQLDTLRLEWHTAVDKIAALQHQQTELFPELRAENARLREALQKVADQWKGADGILPPTPMGAYAVILCQRMARIAADALKTSGAA